MSIKKILKGFSSVVCLKTDSKINFGRVYTKEIWYGNSYETMSYISTVINFQVGVKSHFSGKRFRSERVLETRNPGTSVL